MIGERLYKPESAIGYLITNDSGYTKACKACGRVRWHDNVKLIGKPRELEMAICDGCKAGGKTLYAQCHSG